jgi:ribosome-associated protein
MDASRVFKRADLPPALDAALEAALDVGGRAPTVLRVTEIAGYTDWVLIVSGRVERQVKAICSAVEDALAKMKVKPLGTDGTQEGLWGLLDYDDFLVHSFFHPVRTYYDLESMWSDAPRVELGLPAELMDTADLERLNAPAVMPEFRGDMNFGGFEDEFEEDDEDDTLFADDEEEDDHNPTAPVSPPSAPSNSDLFESDEEE